MNIKKLKPKIIAENGMSTWIGEYWMYDEGIKEGNPAVQAYWEAWVYCLSANEGKVYVNLDPNL